MLGDIFISAERLYLLFVISKYTRQEVSQRLGEEGTVVEIAIHSSIFSGCGSWDLYLTASVTSLFPNSPILQLTRGVVLLLPSFNLGFSGSMATLPVHPSQKFGGFFAFSHSSLMLSLSDLPHVHPFISTLQVQALAVSWPDFKSVTSLVTSCLYTSAPSSRLLRADSLSYPFLQKKKFFKAYMLLFPEVFSHP